MSSNRIFHSQNYGITLGYSGSASTGTTSTPTDANSTGTGKWPAKPEPVAAPAAAVAAVAQATGAPTSCFSVKSDARHRTYAIAIFGTNAQASPCDQPIANAEYFLAETGGSWKVITAGGSIVCPLRGVPHAASEALGLPCGEGGP